MATYTRPFTEASDTIGHASSINRYIDDFASTVNNINSANINDNAIGTDEVSVQIKLFQEVFS